MKIGIDLDGVVLNSELMFMTGAEIFDSKILKRNSIVKKGEPRVQKKYNWSKEELQDYLDRYLLNDDFDIIPGAKEVLDYLKQENNELIAITARGHLNPKEIDIAKKKLNDANIVFDQCYWLHKDKLEICKKLNIDVMIDDRYDVCQKLSKNGIITLYYHMAGRKKIRDTKNIITVNNWGEIYRVISKIKEDLNERN